MTTMMCQVAIVRHASMVNGWLLECQAAIKHVPLTTICTIIMNVCDGSLRWVLGSTDADMRSLHSANQRLFCSAYYHQRYRLCLLPPAWPIGTQRYPLVLAC